MVCGEFIILQKGGQCSFYLQTSEKSRFKRNLNNKKWVVFDTTLKYQEVTKMALSDIFGWNKKEAQPGAACGAADKPEEKPAACGTACGAADKPEEKPAACGTACGAADKPEEKPAACGTACGASDK